MEDNYFEQIRTDIMRKDKWSDFLKRFMDVLRINIFIVDLNGKLLITPNKDREISEFGAIFLKESFEFDFTGKEGNLLDEFEKQGNFLEARDPFDFRCFAIPIKAQKKDVAYLIVGPVILNKKWDNADYLNLAKQLEMDTDALLDEVQDLRVLSFVAMKSILDLLKEVVKDVVEINVERKKLQRTSADSEVLSKRIADVAEDLYARIHLDELLVTILDVALNLTKAECGSIMIIDDDQKYLSIKVSRGIDPEKARSAQVKMGEGIAGMAAQNNEAFIINGDKGSSRINHLLKRPEIKQSVVLPLSSHDKVLGVLNLHTKEEKTRIDDNVGNIKHLSKLITTAINSI